MKNETRIVEMLFAWTIFFCLFYLSIFYISEDWAKSPIGFLSIAGCSLVFASLCEFVGSLEDKDKEK